jgi:steroid 5-alpha reductase family enzyme
MNPWIMIILGWISMAAVMGLLWLLQRRTGDAGIVDVAWGMGVGLLALFFVWGSDSGDLTRRVVIACLALCWALRLSVYILWRVLTMEEDGRYQTLKQGWGSAAQIKLFWFYQLQAIGSLLFALPMLIAARGTSPMGLSDFIGIGIWLVAIGGELIADWQLARFRANPENQGKVCREGFWNYSRHPNYFFEWLHWWAYVCLAISAPWGWLTIIGPLLMLHFIINVTGIPPTEAQALKSRGEAYRKYQQTTNAFFPWPPKMKQVTS